MWAATLAACLVLPVLLLLLSRESVPAKPHMVPGRKFLLGKVIVRVFDVFNFLRLTPRWLRKRVTMTEMRAAAGFPLDQDTLPDRDTFEALWTEPLNFLNNGGDDVYRIDSIGAILNKIQLLNSLKGRKELVEAPPVENLRRLPRLIVVGQPRTGTTILSRLMNALPEIWGPTMRQMRNPVKEGVVNPAPAAKFAKAVNPIGFAIHPIEVDGHEEDQILMMLSGPCLLPPAAPVVFWLDGENGWRKHAPTVYKQFRDNIDRVASKYAPAEATHMALKFPGHPLYAEELCMHGTHPDQPIVLIRTYRKQLKKVLESNLSLARSAADLCCHDYDQAALERDAIAAFSESMEGYKKFEELAAREPGRIKVVDVAFDDVVSKPVETIFKLREACGLPAYDEARRAEVAEMLTRQVEETGSYRKSKYATFHGYELSEASLAAVKELEKKQDAMLRPI